MSTADLHQRALDRLAELRAEDARASSAPWWVHDENDCDLWYGDQSAVRAVDQDCRAERPLMTDDEIEATWDCAGTIGKGEVERPEDAALIATMRSAWPAVLDGIEARLTEHAPHHEQRGTRACPRCLLDWPCPTISADLAVLGIDPTEGEPDEKR